MAIIGIDLGTTNSLVCVFRSGKAELIPNAAGEYLTPSCVGLDDDCETLLIGRTARDRLISHPALTVGGFKRLMGKPDRLSLGRHSYSAAELSSLVIRQLRDDAEAYLGESVQEAVVSVPAYFDDNGRSAVKEAGELAGLRVERIINEPSAAALAYRENDTEDTTFLVFDLGGGTLDVTVVEAFENIIEVVSAAGNNQLGGGDFDRAIAGWFCRESGLSFDALPAEEKAVLLRQAELGKVALNGAETVILSCRLGGQERALPLDNRKLVEISAALFRKMETVVRRALQDADKTVSDIDRVVMVGGSSKMLSVRRYIAELTGAELCSGIDPEQVVGIGAGLSAGIKMRVPELRDMILTDVCPFSLGVNIINRSNNDDPLFSPIIPRNSALPASRMGTYWTAVDWQKAMTFNIYQGDALYCRDNLLLGTLEIPVPVGMAGEQSCEARFSYDINGILEVDIRCVSTGLTISKVILSKQLRLSEKELAEKRAALQKLKILPRDEEANKALIARAEQLYIRCSEPLRGALAFETSQFTAALGTQDEKRIRPARQRFSDVLDQIGRKTDSFDVFRRDEPEDEDD